MTDGEFDEFFRATYPSLVAFGVTMGSPVQVAQELAQETLVRAYRHRERLASFDRPAGWCRRVMSNLLIDQHRSRSAERGALDRLAQVPPTSAVEEVSFDDELAAWVRLLEPLTVKQRCIATLFYAEDQSVASIASELGISVGSVKTTLARARKKVATHLQETSETGEA